MSYRSRLVTGLAISLALIFSACVQQAQQGMTAGDPMTGQKMKTASGMMDKMEKDENMKTEQMKGQNNNPM